MSARSASLVVGGVRDPSPTGPGASAAPRLPTLAGRIPGPGLLLQRGHHLATGNAAVGLPACRSRSGSDGEPDGAQVVSAGGLGERLGRRYSGCVNLEAEHPPRPLHAEVLDGAGVQGGRRLRVVQQLPAHPGDVPVQGDLDVGAVVEVIAPGASVSVYSSPSSRCATTGMS